MNVIYYVKSEHPHSPHRARAPATRARPVNRAAKRLRVFQAMRYTRMAAGRYRFSEVRFRQSSSIIKAGSSMADKTAAGTKESHFTRPGAGGRAESSQAGRKRGRYVTTPMPRMVRKIVS